MALSLTKTQMNIVNHVDGALQVIAGPGSGKTRVLTERIINLLSMNRKRILALTFSNKAAEEIKERIEQRLGTDLQEQVFVGTIHSFCLDVVINRGNLIGLPPGMVIFESEEDKITILKRVLTELPELKYQLMGLESNGQIFKNCLRQISQFKQEFILPEVLKDSNKETDRVFSKLYEAYNNMMLSQRALDFDDILLYAYRIFTERPQIATSYTRLYKYIFIDEAQDLNAAQYKVIKALCAGFSNIMMVGDPAQSIYGFNGSESEFMTNNFKEDFNPTEYKLIENFRSTKRIIDAAKKIQNDIDSNAVYPLDGELLIQSFDNEELEAEWVIAKINDLLKNGSEWVEVPLTYERISVIARNRYVLSKVSEKLEENEIPFNYGTSSRSVESESIAIKIFEAGIRVIINPFDDVHFNQILNLLNYNQDILEERKIDNNLDMLLRLDESKLTPEYQNYYRTVRDALKVLIEDEENFTRAINILSKSFIETKLNENSQEDQIENEQYFIQKDIDMWKEHWKKYCSHSVSGQRSLAHFRNQVSLGLTQTYCNLGVSLLTVHASKGLEFDVVFLIGLTEGTFPDYRAKGEKEFKEELNNMFVALTRAKRMCYISYPNYKIMPWGNLKLQKPSSFIQLMDVNSNLF